MALIDNSLLVLHAKNPKFNELLLGATHSATLDNASCGDSVSVTFIVDNDIVVQVGFSSRGCMLCRAATSILLSHIVGFSVDRVSQLTDDDLLSMLGSIEVSYSRRKCALMGLDAIRMMFEHKI